MFASRLSVNDNFQNYGRLLIFYTECYAGAAPIHRLDRTNSLIKYIRFLKPPLNTIQVLQYFKAIHIKANGSLTRDMRSAISRTASGIIRLSRIATRLLVLKMNTTSTKWVKLDKFCEQTGFTRKSVYALIRNGRWMVAKHFTIRNRRYFINIVEYERWVERG